MSCDPIPDYENKRENLINIIDACEGRPELKNHVFIIWINFKIGVSELFFKKYVSSLRYLNTVRDKAKETNNFSFVLISTLMIVNVLIVLSKFCEATQLLDIMKIETKTHSFLEGFEKLKRDQTVSIQNIEALSSLHTFGDEKMMNCLFFDDDFYQETTDICKVKAKSDLKPAIKQTACSKIKESPAFKKIRMALGNFKKKVAGMFEK